MAEFRVAVLASGSGTNLQALIDQVHLPGIATLVVVGSDNPQAGALARARQAAINTFALAPAPGEGRSSYHLRLAERLSLYRPQLVVLAGYMRLLPAAFIHQFAPVINVHPSLLPAFPGLDAPRQALEYGVKVTGCTVHLVDAGVDTGPVLLQQPVPVHAGDTPASLHARIKAEEHRLLVRAVTAFACRQVRQQGRKVWIEEDGNEG